MFKMLKDTLNLVIKRAIEAQSQALETMVTQKRITILSTVTTNYDRIYNYLREENLRLQN